MSSSHDWPPELWSCLRELLGGTEESARLVDHEQLKRRVHRLRFRTDGPERSFVVKRSRPDVAQRNHLLATRWLPAIGLDDHGPALLALVGTKKAGLVWHVYEDLGDHVLANEAPVRDEVEATVGVVARLHTRSTNHPLLAECLVRGGDLGMHFYSSSIRAGLDALDAVEPDAHPRLAPVRERLLDRLRRLQAEEPERALALRSLGIPATLLHGDLWTLNVLLVPDGAGVRVRLIDWDHVGVGPVSYDLSTFLLRFPPEHRSWILDAYREEIHHTAGWRLAAGEALDVAFETAEYTRLSSMVRGGADAVRSPHAEWAVDRLEAIDSWFAAYEPVLSP